MRRIALGVAGCLLLACGSDEQTLDELTRDPSSATALSKASRNCRRASDCIAPSGGTAACNRGNCVYSCNIPTNVWCTASQACVDTMSDARNCGGCGTVCGSNASCVSGICECNAGATLCGKTCVDTTSDARNCRDCGRTCGPDQTCTASECVPAVSCAGCVQDGICYPGNMQIRCGTDGAPCTACSLRQNCLTGTCEPNVTSCVWEDPFGGCHVGDACYPGGGDARCGEFGIPCMTCPTECYCLWSNCWYRDTGQPCPAPYAK